MYFSCSFSYDLSTFLWDFLRFYTLEFVEFILLSKNVCAFVYVSTFLFFSNCY